MAGNVKFTRPSNLRVPVSYAADVSALSEPDYPLTALMDGLPAKPAWFDTAGPIRITYDLGSAVRVDGFAMPNHNLAAGTVVSVQMNATDVWTSPTVNGSMTVGADHANGHRASPWIDLTQVAGYSAGGFRYLSILIPVQATNIKVGETLILGVLEEFDEWPQFQGTKGVRRRFLEALETEYGVQRVNRRKITQRTFNFIIKGSDADYAKLQELGDETSGLAVAFFVTQDGSVQTDGGLYARFTRETAEKLEATEEWFNVNPFTFAVMELSRSLPL